MLQTGARGRVNHITIREVTCQCEKCKDMFTVDGRFKHDTLTSLLPHRKIRLIDLKPVHKCGGKLRIIGCCVMPF